MLVEIKIPVAPHVRKYLTARYGTVHTLSKTSLIGQLLFICLDNKADKPDKLLPNEYHYKVEIPEKYFNTKGHTVQRNALKQVSDLCEKLFREEMRRYVDIAVSSGAEARPEIQRFLEHYGISEDDIKLESLYKDYKRYSGFAIRSKKRRV